MLCRIYILSVPKQKAQGPSGAVCLRVCLLHFSFQCRHLTRARKRGLSVISIIQPHWADLAWHDGLRASFAKSCSCPGALHVTLPLCLPWLLGISAACLVSISCAWPPMQGRAGLGDLEGIAWRSGASLRGCSNHSNPGAGQASAPTRNRGLL